LELWRNSLNLLAKHPLFGTGPGGYVVYYYTYHREERRTTHNDYLDVLAQTGLVGFGMYLSFFATLLWTGYRLSRKLAGRHDFEAALANGLLGACVGALVAMMLGDWIVPFVYNQTIMGFDHSVYAWVLMGCLVSLHHVVRAREQAR
jgi:O-antigen ligase